MGEERGIVPAFGIKQRSFDDFGGLEASLNGWPLGWDPRAFESMKRKTLLISKFKFQISAVETALRLR